MRKKRRKKRYHYKVGYHKSPKAGKVHYRSSYELKYYRLLDADPSVITYIPEPFIIPYVFRKRDRNYKPDVLVTHTNGEKTLVEVKPLALVNGPKNKAKMISAKAYCRENGLIYRLITERDLGLPFPTDVTSFVRRAKRGLNPTKVRHTRKT